jgi:hypothetical protein
LLSGDTISLLLVWVSHATVAGVWSTNLYFKYEFVPADGISIKRNFRWKSEAVSQERTFLDKYVTNTNDRGTIGIISRMRIISILRISVA